MSFLSRLLERHREDGSTSLALLEPRLPSRFEPVTGAETRLDLAPDVSGEAPARAAAPPPAPARAGHGAPSPGDRRPPETAEARVSAVRSALDTAPRTIDAPSPPIARDAPSNAPVREGARPADPARAPATDAAELAPAPSAARPPAVTAVGRGSHDALVPPASPSTRRMARERDTAPLGSEPTVHVTIGRVDVRAVFPPVPASPHPVPPRETRSLEEYLRRRDRAGR